MTADEFINKWMSAINYLQLPTVGIHVGWDRIPRDSNVSQFTGLEAWNKIYSFTPPWFQAPKTFQQLIDDFDSNYKSEIVKEIANGKMQRFASQGLADPHFCAFTDPSESIIILGDGNHRFLNCSYLMNLGKDLSNDIARTELDIIYLSNFEEIMRTTNIWNSQITHD